MVLSALRLYLVWWQPTVRTVSPVCVPSSCPCVSVGVTGAALKGVFPGKDASLGRDFSNDLMLET